eukprot:scaffold16412_cov171-Amphora_coffeaeformis.AAC.5
MNRLVKTTLGSLVVATVAVQQVSSAGLFGRPSVLSRWGERSTFVQQEKTLSLSQRLSLREIRGGATEVEEESDKPEQLYLPGLLDASVVRSNSATTAKSDCEITISASKAKELGVKAGDIVVLIGRRRKASYATVSVAKKAKKEVCKVSANLAANLKLRSEDKLKVVPLAVAGDAAESRSGDLLLLNKPDVPSVESVTFSPIEDSLQNLIAAEGGDEIPDEEIQARFVQPYLEDMGGAVLKQGHVIRLMDENGKKLEFMVSHVDLAGEDPVEEADGKI